MSKKLRNTVYLTALTVLIAGLSACGNNTSATAPQGEAQVETQSNTETLTDTPTAATEASEATQEEATESVAEISTNVFGIDLSEFGEVVHGDQYCLYETETEKLFTFYLEDMDPESLSALQTYLDTSSQEAYDEAEGFYHTCYTDISFTYTSKEEDKMTGSSGNEVTWPVYHGVKITNLALTSINPEY